MPAQAHSLMISAPATDAPGALLPPLFGTDRPAPAGPVKAKA